MEDVPLSSLCAIFQSPTLPPGHNINRFEEAFSEILPTLCHSSARPCPKCDWRKEQIALLVRKLVPNGSQEWRWQHCALFLFIWSVNICATLSSSSHGYKQGNLTHVMHVQIKLNDRGLLRNLDREHPGLSRGGEA